MLCAVVYIVYLQAAYTFLHFLKNKRDAAFQHLSHFDLPSLFLQLLTLCLTTLFNYQLLFCSASKLASPPSDLIY